ncbi:MAG: hypothetical protein AMXMBFR13_15110 [Phycisphaerae bacterium]
MASLGSRDTSSSILYEGASQHRVCPLCQSRPARAMLLYAWICDACRTEFLARRGVAFLVDLGAAAGICGLLLGLVALFGLINSDLTPSIPITIGLLFPLKDGFAGYSPGKWLTDLRVVDRQTRQPAGFLASLRRNLVLFVPFAVLVLPILLLDGTRPGDAWAGATVIWRRHAGRFPFREVSRRCIHCGYDLTGNRSGYCPECGMDVPVETRRVLSQL